MLVLSIASCHLVCTKASGEQKIGMAVFSDDSQATKSSATVDPSS